MKRAAPVSRPRDLQGCGPASLCSWLATTSPPRDLGVVLDLARALLPEVGATSPRPRAPRCAISHTRKGLQRREPSVLGSLAPRSPPRTATAECGSGCKSGSKAAQHRATPPVALRSWRLIRPMNPYQWQSPARVGGDSGVPGSARHLPVVLRAHPALACVRRHRLADVATSVLVAPGDRHKCGIAVMRRRSDAFRAARPWPAGSSVDLVPALPRSHRPIAMT